MHIARKRMVPRWIYTHGDFSRILQLYKIARTNGGFGAWSDPSLPLEEGLPLALSGNDERPKHGLSFPPTLSHSQGSMFAQNADQGNVMCCVSESRETARRLFARSLTVAATSRQALENYEVAEK